MSFRDQIQSQQNMKFEPRKFEFHPNFHKQVKLKAKTTETGRTYTSPNGVELVSMTTMLDVAQDDSKKKALENWRKRVGQQEAERITNEAAKRGDILHQTCENYIKYPDKFVSPEPGTNAYALFKQIYPCFDNIGKVYGIEQNLYSEKWGIAGTADCIAEYNGILSIIDFKTTIKEKNKKWITDYFCQETGYAVMYADLYGIKVKQIVTLMAKDYGFFSEPQIFIEKPCDYVELLYNKLQIYKQRTNQI